MAAARGVESRKRCGPLFVNRMIRAVYRSLPLSIGFLRTIKEMYALHGRMLWLWKRPISGKLNWNLRRELTPALQSTLLQLQTLR